jgi:hypothetical protein
LIISLIVEETTAKGNFLIVDLMARVNHAPLAFTVIGQIGLAGCSAQPM